ncbi:MAG: hypothetical protein U0R19_16800 [Bryobacteraceae bacterium]
MTQEQGPARRKYLDSLQTHGTWLYGVIISLVLREALVRIVPRLFSPPITATISQLSLEACRLCLLITVLVRFFFGSVKYFGASRLPDDAADDIVEKSLTRFAGDFSLGLVHFLVFFMAAAVLDQHARLTRAQLSVFQLVLIFVLSYDLIWYFLIKASRDSFLVRRWAFLNTFTVLLLLLLHCLLLLVFEATAEVTELLSFAPLAFVSIVDIRQLFLDRETFAKFFNYFWKEDPPGTGS